MRNKFAKVSDPNDFVTCPGEDTKIVYAPKVLPDGSIELVESSKINIQDMINADRENTDMAYILRKMKEGDTSVLVQREGVYGDFTEFPKTYAEILQLRIDSEASFYGLNPEIRARFDNDFNKYFASAGSDEWFDKLGVSRDAKVEESVPKVEGDDKE